MEYTKIVRIPHIKNKLLVPEEKFLHDLNIFMDTPIYLYGSILRGDYFSTKSDLDVAIFANDSVSAVNKLILFLGINKTKIKVFKFESRNKQTYKKIKTYGYKTNYILPLTYFLSVLMCLYILNKANSRFGSCSGCGSVPNILSISSKID